MTAGEARAARRAPRATSGEPRGEGERAWEAALRLLAQRARSQEEVRRALSRRGHGAGEVEGVLERLRAARYLDDRTFARDWTRSRADRCGAGPARLSRELRAKGISDEDIQAALGELLAERSPQALAEAAARRKLKALQGVPPVVGQRRLAAYLSRRGFSAEVILRLCRQLFPGAGESPEGA